MGLALVQTRTLEGMEAEPVQVEVHLANGLPCMTLVGLADTEVREARERVRSALGHSGWDYPVNQRITVSLAPADLPKASSRFDLPIALGILAAQGILDAQALRAHEFAGELSLAGELRPVHGALALALGLRRSAQAAGQPPARAAFDWATGASLRPSAAASAAPAPALCLRDIRGQSEGKRALEVAAAGHHSMLLVGPPGAGKSMLAQRLPGLLPPLSPEQALECAALRSLAGGLGVASRASRAGPESATGWRTRPWRAPHHSCTMAALVGGGQPPRPGEISLADHGLLFLTSWSSSPGAPWKPCANPWKPGM
jgi:magnesium chelatase family protein